MVTVLPSELQRYIFQLLWADETANLARVLRARTGNVANDPFYRAGMPLVTRIGRRAVGECVPPLLVPLYAEYEPTVQFSDDAGLTFLAEASMDAHADGRVVDFALEYHGMGHVLMHSYRKCSDTVMTFLDGGANGYDRLLNRRLRTDAMTHFGASGVCEGPWGRPLPFLTWWNARRSARAGRVA